MAQKNYLPGARDPDYLRTKSRLYSLAERLGLRTKGGRPKVSAAVLHLVKSGLDAAEQEGIPTNEAATLHLVLSALVTSLDQADNYIVKDYLSKLPTLETARGLVKK